MVRAGGEIVGTRPGEGVIGGALWVRCGSVTNAKAIFATALRGFREHRLTRLAAALAYYALFSLAPLLVIVFGIAGIVWGDTTAQEELFSQLESAVGDDITDTVRTLVDAREGSGRSGDIVATAVGAVLLFVGASGVFLQLQDSLNTVWDVPLDQVKGIGATVRKRILGFVAVIVLGVLLTAFIAGSAAVAFFASEISDRLGGLNIAVQIATPLVAFLGVSFIIALIFKFMPKTSVPWGAAWKGGMATTVLLALGAAVIGALFGIADPGASFGEFASIIVLLVFIYYMSQIFFLGAEVTAAVVKVDRGEGADGDSVPDIPVVGKHRAVEDGEEVEDAGVDDVR